MEDLDSNKEEATPELGGPLFYDEGLEILNRFLKQTIKDYLNPSLKYSRLTSDRQYWETARDYILGYTAVQWGDETSWLSFNEAAHIFNIDTNWVIPHLEQERILHEEQYLLSGKRKKKDLMIPVAYVHCPSESLKSEIRTKLKKVGITSLFPIISTLSQQSETSILSPYLSLSVEELKTLEDNPELLNQASELRNEVCRRLDRNNLLINKIDIIIIIWTAGINELQVHAELVNAYRMHIPSFILALEDGPAIETEILALTSAVWFSQTEMEEKLKQLVGSGRATIYATVKPRLLDIINKQ